MKGSHTNLCARAQQVRRLMIAALLLSFSSTVAAAGLSGTARTGNQPLTNASVRLFQVGTTGYGSPVTLAGQTTTGVGGVWHINTITCNPASIDVFVIARSKMGTGPIRILAYLGPCNALPNNVVINEVTSIAALWATAQFTDPDDGAIGAPASNSKGLVNAGLNAANLADVTTGTTPGLGLPAGTTVPSDKIRTLADIMAACDVTGGPPAAPCKTLFGAVATGSDGPPPDTLSAMLFVALFPVHNVSQLFGLVGATPPFTPALTASPADWSLAVNFASAQLLAPGQVAIDAGGNVWVANGSANSLSKFNAAGRPASVAAFVGGGLNLPVAVAINSKGDVWVANEGNNTLSEFGPDGTAISPVGGFSGGGLQLPQAIAIDTTDRVWVANCGNFCDQSGVASNVSIFSSAGTPMTAAQGILGGGLNGASGIAMDVNGNMWVANEGNSSLSKFNSQGMVLSPSAGFVGGGLFDPVSVAVSSTNFVWVTDQLGNAVSEFTSTGTAQSGSAGITGGGIVFPLGIAIDSSKNKWIANSTGIAEIDGTGAVISPNTGFVDPNNDEPFAIATDPSGNVWVTNTHNNSLTELVGIAGPVKTPVIGPATLP
jgi:streptogramin lyase